MSETDKENAHKIIDHMQSIQMDAGDYFNATCIVLALFYDMKFIDDSHLEHMNSYIKTLRVREE